MKLIRNFFYLYLVLLNQILKSVDKMNSKLSSIDGKLDSINQGIVGLNKKMNYSLVLQSVMTYKLLKK